MTGTAVQLRAMLADPGTSGEALMRAGLAALKVDLLEAVERRFAQETAGREARNPRAWQILGLARRDLQDSAGANAAFTRAGKLAPTDALIAHSQARTAMEAGRRAVALFDRARALAPADGSVILGRAAAQLAAGDGVASLADLARLLAANPGWIEGHRTYARIAAIVDPAGKRMATLRAAAARLPRQAEVWMAMYQIASEGSDYQAARDVIGEARKHIGGGAELDRLEAIAMSELGDAQAAQAVFDRLPAPANGEASVFPIRNLIRLGRHDEALRLAERPLGKQGDLPLWPYRALLWRLLGDARWEWLEGDERLIAGYDVGLSDAELATLAEVLRAIHTGKGQPLDQSVRGGTQTDGNVLAREEPEIRRLRQALLETVARHVVQLPPHDPRHPTLPRVREPLRIAGAWSVRLTGKGFHVDHVHYQGWLSSALYVALPEGDAGIGRGGGGEAGWLAFGECLSILPDFKAFRTIEPKVGRLALFPSTTWHGTRPFGEGERMTVAFDIAPPRQDAA
ncbi:MAG: hypothetical protein KGL48_00395 [Sphingomonadales bacterium]|nr:hypothetical protein [Sphingomonadales bacterium]MDE2567891.1 hypothetical protein [Sphingomonadales bacterium]